MKTLRSIACLTLVLAAPGAFAADKICKLDINSTDFAFAGRIYPKGSAAPSTAS